jgi:hypothetical protein
MGVEQRWSRNRPEEAYGADRPEALFAEEMDSRAHYLAWLGQNRRSLGTTSGCRRAEKHSHLCCNESLDGEEI